MSSLCLLLKIIPDLRVQNTLLNKEGMQTGCIEHILHYITGKNFKAPEIYKLECDYNNFSKTVESIKHSSPALIMACNHLRRKKNGEVLIVGQSLSKNTDFFVDRYQGVYNVDLFPHLQWQRNDKIRRPFSDAFLNLDPDINFDFILF
ncbi:MAG: hypothetical protein ACJAUP_003826 [Cellvibrionaceae bacterium]|jgi:hypothetical protein